ncbi:MAG: M48 family metallopeptidase, partial [Halobacteriaceae archaeon]
MGIGLLLLVLYSDIFSNIIASIQSLQYGPIISGVIFFGGTVIITQIFSLPFNAVDTFVIEEIFEFNQQTPSLWMKDTILQTGISLVFVGILGGAVLLFIDIFPTLWWLAAWILFIAFSLVMQVIYPRLIAPLFYNFEPIESGDLREAVNDVFDRAGFSCDQIYVMDASRRSTHSNAYFIGFGQTKRVVLFDTLIDQMEIPEIQSVLAHELAHWKKGHIWKRLITSSIRMGIVFFVLYYLLQTQWLYSMFGVPSVPYVGLFLAGIWVYPINRLLAPLQNQFSLKHEREADQFAIEVMDTGQPMVDALTNLVSENLSNPFPHPLYERFHYSHPPIPERIQNIEEQAETSTTND